MSSPRTETTVRSDPPADKPKGVQLNPVQVAAGALAAVSSAVGASFFGVAGTLIGAAVGSVIASVCTALYTESLRRTKEGLERVLARRPDDAAPGEEPAATAVLPAHLSPRQAPGERSGPRWSRIGIYAAAVFVVAMAIVTGIELVGQKPVSALVGDTASSGSTTLGQLTNTSSERDITPSTPTTEAPASTPAEQSPAEPSPAEPTPEGEDAEEAPTTPSPEPSWPQQPDQQPGSEQSGSQPSSPSSAPSPEAAPDGLAGATPAPTDGAEATPVP
jgi:hypothetical protein